MTYIPGPRATALRAMREASYATEKARQRAKPGPDRMKAAKEALNASAAAQKPARRKK